MAGEDEEDVSDALRRLQLASATGLTLFVMAASDDACGGTGRGTPRMEALKQAVLPVLHQVRTQSPAREGDQAVVDAVVSVMGRAWRPSARWREHLTRVGRPDLASW